MLACRHAPTGLVVGAPQRRGQQLGADRLGQVVVHSRLPAPLAVRVGRIRSHRDDPRLRPVERPDALRRLVAVEVRHLDVHEDDVDVEPTCGLDGGGPVTDDGRRVSEALEQPGHQALFRRVVLGHEDVQRMPSCEPGVEAGRGRGVR